MPSLAKCFPKACRCRLKAERYHDGKCHCGEPIPGVGPLTIEVVLSELSDVRRFRLQKDVAAYAGLAPVCRESAGKVKHGGITKEGSRMLRWILVEAA